MVEKMMNFRLYRYLGILSITLLAGCDSVMGEPSSSLEQDPPVVAVLLDGSTSFLPWIDEAQLVVTRFLARNSVNGTAQVYVYRIDRDPKLIEVVKQFDFVQKETKDLIAQIKNPDNAPGTDIIGAIEQARIKLSQAGNGPKYLLVFTDGLVYAPKVNGARLPYGSLDQYDWSQLAGIQTRFYFLETEPYRTLAAKARPVLPELQLFEAPEGADPKEIMAALEDIR